MFRVSVTLEMTA